MEKRQMFGKVILAVLCGMALSNATAATLYVSSSAGAGGDGSEASPFNTVAAAVSALNEGDVILLEKGSTFNETLYWPATTSTFNLTIGTYGSGDAPIWTPGNSSSGRLKVIECQRILTLDGIDFRMYNGQAFDALKLQGGSGHNISNCTFTDAAYAVAAFYLPAATLSNCKFINGYYQMAIVQAGVTLDKCEFTGTAVYPVNMIYGSTVTVQDCYFHDLNSASSATGLIGANTFYTNPQVLTVTGSVFHNNSGYVHLNALNHDLTATFTNNTAYLQEKSFVRDNNTGKDSQVTAKNNIFVGTTTTYAALLQLDNGSHADLFSDYNLFYNNPTDVSGTTAGANSIVGVDPLFLSTMPGDADFLRIGINSPAATAGEGGTYMGAYAPYVNGCVVYSKPLFELVLPDYQPSAQEILDGPISFTASRDEYVPATFSLFTTNELNDVTVSVTNLTSGSHVISGEDIDLRVVKCWEQRHPDDWNTSSLGQAIVVPELLVKDDRIALTGYFSSMPLTSYVATDIPANTSKQFWMTIKTTASTVPGDYTGTINIQPANASAFSIDVVLTVLPIKLAQTDKKYAIYYHGSAFGLDWWPEKTMNQQAWDNLCNEELIDIREHGCNSAFSYAKITGTTVGENLQLDFTNLRKSLQFHVNNGLSGFTPWTFQKSSIDGVLLRSSSYGNTPEEQQLFYTTIMRVVEQAEQMLQTEFNNIPELYYYGVDEPVGDSAIEICDNMFNAIHVGGGLTTTALYRYDYNGNDCGFDVLGPVTDLPVYHYNNFTAESTAIQDLAVDLQTKEDVWTYWQSWVEDPRQNRLCAGYFLWKAGFTGCMPYNYAHTSGDPYDDFDSTLKDMCTAYPSLEGPIPTLQWEAFRVGVNDVRYLTTLIALRDKSTDTQKIANANAVIDQIMGQLDISDFSCVSDSDLMGFRSLVIDTIMTNFSDLLRIAGDANEDGMVDVGDLGILAANYGTTSNATWLQGDFNDDGAVDVGDLGILAANYGMGARSVDWDVDYARAFGESIVDDDSEIVEETYSSLCGVLGLPLIAGLALMGLMLVKSDE